MTSLTDLLEERVLLLLEGLVAAEERVVVVAQRRVLALQLLGLPARALVLEPDGDLARLQAELPRQLQLLGFWRGSSLACVANMDSSDLVCSSLKRFLFLSSAPPPFPFPPAPCIIHSVPSSSAPSMATHARLSDHDLSLPQLELVSLK